MVHQESVEEVGIALDFDKEEKGNSFSMNFTWRDTYTFFMVGSKQ